MQTLNDTKQQWQDLAFESFMNMVKARDGDFDAIYKLSAALNDDESFKIMIEALSRHPQGERAFEEYPRLGNVELEKLHQLSENTLGYAYAEHMLRNNLKPLQASVVNNDSEFFVAHITETHDIWHVVTGCDTNITGEIQLEAFYVAQLYASRFWLALLAKNLLKAVVYDIELTSAYMNALTKGWNLGKEAKSLFGIQWNTLWETPLEEIRASLGLNHVGATI
jgi:ubiquinone biosynthesis protein COQ4